jgi:DedD protein
MSLFSFLRKNKQESASDDSAYVARTEDGPNATRSRGKRRKSNQNEQVDPVLPEKKRARRRLIGAIALVLAAIIGLPMILDSEPKPLADDIAIQIPSKDKPAQSENRRPVPDSEPKLSAPPDPKEEVVETPVAPVIATPVPKPAASTPVVPPKPAEVEASAEKKDEGRDGGKPAEPVKPAVAAKPPKPDSKTESEASEKTDDTERAMALLEGKSDPKSAAEKKSGKFVIQVAALATKEKVSEVQAKLKNAGIDSYTQKVATDSGERIRIRVGPFSSRDEADKVRAKIGKLGMNGSLMPA